MKPITLRGVPPEVERTIRKRTKETGLSRNRVIIGLLEEAVGLRKGKKNVLYHDLDSLAGSWNEHEAAAFDRALAEQRRIDPELWK